MCIPVVCLEMIGEEMSNHALPSMGCVKKCSHVGRSCICIHIVIHIYIYDTVTCLFKSPDFWYSSSWSFRYARTTLDNAWQLGHQRTSFEPTYISYGWETLAPRTQESACFTFREYGNLRKYSIWGMMTYISTFSDSVWIHRDRYNMIQP